MKIIDTFIFNDELDLLELRLEILYDTVDYFILVEGNETFKGNVKPLFYTLNKSRFNKYNNKIIVIKNDSTEYNNLAQKDGLFTREYFSRDIINEHLIKLNLDENDIILHSDLDEIPNPKFLNLLKTNKYNFTFASIKMQLYYYNFETIDKNTNWYGTSVIYYKYLKRNMSYYRRMRNHRTWNIDINLDESDVYGWHFSYFGDYDLIQNKILSFSEKTSHSSKIINNKINLYNFIKSKKLWFSKKKLDHIDFDTNKYLLKTPQCIKLYKKLKLIANTISNV